MALFRVTSPPDAPALGSRRYPPAKVTFEDVAEMALALPRSSRASATATAPGWSPARSSPGNGPSAKADFRRFGDATSPQGPILAVRVEDPGGKEAALQAQPEAFFTIPHFDGFSAVLIRLETIRSG